MHPPMCRELNVPLGRTTIHEKSVNARRDEEVQKPCIFICKVCYLCTFGNHHGLGNANARCSRRISIDFHRSPVSGSVTDGPVILRTKPGFSTLAKITMTADSTTLFSHPQTYTNFLLEDIECENSAATDGILLVASENTSGYFLVRRVHARSASNTFAGIISTTAK